MQTLSVGWYQAWRTAATGQNGFWRKYGPAEHLRTAATASSGLAQMVGRLLARRPDIWTVVALGAGDGQLLAALHRLQPRLRLIGVDVRSAASGLTTEAGIEWRIGEWNTDSADWCWADPGQQREGPVSLSAPGSAGSGRLAPAEGSILVVCAEWLDDLPCVVATRTVDGWCEILTAPDGEESVGASVGDQDAQWLDRWWPNANAGVRAESGRTRDEAWSAVITALRPAGGLAVMIDYGHLQDGRPTAGTLTGYSAGRQVPPQPSTEINLTAHVAVDAIAAAGEAAGAVTELLISQREAVDLLLPGRRPLRGTLARLQEQGERRLLSDTMGDHWWLVQRVPAEPPLA